MCEKTEFLNKGTVPTLLTWTISDWKVDEKEAPVSKGIARKDEN